MIQQHKFLLTYIENHTDLNLNNKTYVIPELFDLQTALNATSKYIEDHQTSIIKKNWANTNLFHSEMPIIKYIGNIKNLTYNWIEGYEILKTLNLIPKESSEFIHLDQTQNLNTFIYAVHHFITTNRNWSEKYDYIHTDSSINESYDKTFYQKLYTKFEHTIDLYTGAIQTFNPISKQVIINDIINHIITALLTLKPHGSFILKSTILLDPFIISLIYAISGFFNNFYIIKPASSSTTNLDIYYVGKMYHTTATLTHPYIIVLLEYLLGDKPISIPLFNLYQYPPEYQTDIIKAFKILINQYTKHIHHQISHLIKYEKVPKLIPMDIYAINEWYMKMRILPLLPNKQLQLNTNTDILK